jgi:hypothetical protein
MLARTSLLSARVARQANARPKKTPRSELVVGDDVALTLFRVLADRTTASGHRGVRGATQSQSLQ